jgi:hypothetical protein
MTTHTLFPHSASVPIASVHPSASTDPFEIALFPFAAAVAAPPHASVAPEDEEPEEITDPYDPYVPNDLLQFWDRQAIAQEREKLEQATRLALGKQRLLREQLEHERQELQRKGDFGKLILTTGMPLGGMGRGRGRGVSNLPAWLKKRQEQEQALHQQQQQQHQKEGGGLGSAD